MRVHLLTERPRDIAPLLLDEQGRLKVVPAQILAETSAAERGAFGVRYGAYGFVTSELVEHLSVLLAGVSALEVGAGNGVLAEALGIRATDNRQQELPHIRAVYEGLNQALVPYGERVEKLDALSAARRYRPHTVLACWTTHRYDPARHWAGGNEDGVREEELLSLCERYVFIGNEAVHARKSLWALPHEKHHPPWLYSRALNGSPNFIAVWHRNQSGL